MRNQKRYRGGEENLGQMQSMERKEQNMHGRHTTWRTMERIDHQTYIENYDRVIGSSSGDD